jgi:ribonuclease E
MKRMLVDATHPEETRVAIVDERRLEDFDFESTGKKQLKGNIYLAKVIRIEPSLQAAFVEYGGNRHGFLPFSEIHPDYFRIPIADRPHDEEASDADDDIEISAEAYAEEVSAYQVEPVDQEHEHIHIHHELEHSHNEHPTDAHFVPETEALEGLSPQETELPLSGEDALHLETGSEIVTDSAIVGLGMEAGQELGLITDFGNAIVEPLFVATPVETVGGEVAEEEEERIRRPRMRQYKIQEVVKRRQVMLIQVVKEERGNKGAALTTFLSLAGRYCVLMPNTDRGGGVSRKITSHQDRKRMKDMLDQLETPEGMAVILRTAGMEQEPSEIQRDLEHLLRLWNNIREQTLASTAPTLIYEEANLIKRSIRDLFAADVAEILVSGQKGYNLAHDFVKSIMPEGADRVKLYEDQVPLFFRYNVEKQIDALYNPVVQLRSGGYIVINPTEALVSIDVNSGRATRERNIEGTALKTNLEAAEEIGRQLRLRDLAGLVVIDFIDMEDGRNNAAVERRVKEAMKADRARLQIGRISPFGLLELSRQRLHPSLTEINFERCSHCAGIGLVRSVDSSAISILRMIEEDGIRQSGGEMILHVPTKVALYILNQKRSVLHEIERRYSLTVLLHSDDSLVPPDCKMERVRSGSGETRLRAPAVDSDQVLAASSTQGEISDVVEAEVGDVALYQPRQENDRNNRRQGRSGRGRDRNRSRSERPPFNPSSNGNAQAEPLVEPNGNIVPQGVELDESIGNVAPAVSGESRDEAPRHGGRRRGRRGGRGRHGGRDERGERRPENREGTPSEGMPRETHAPMSQGGDRKPYAPSPVVIPTSIHEIDTTPSDPRAPAPSYVPASKSIASAPPPSPYEVTNPESDKPKGGWWRKLTGQ